MILQQTAQTQCTYDVIQQVSLANSSPSTEVQLQVSKVHVEVIVAGLVVYEDTQLATGHLKPLSKSLHQRKIKPEQRVSDDSGAVMEN